MNIFSKFFSSSESETKDDKGQEERKQEQQALDRAINSPHPGASHNYGQPKEAPYAKAGSKNGERSDPTAKKAQHHTDCQKQHMESLQCIEQNYDNRGVCQPFFNAYRECRREENERIRQERAARGGSW